MDKKNSPSNLDTYFKQHWQSFFATYGSLRLFSEQLPAAADRLDEQIIEEMAETIADTFGDPREQVRTELREFLPSLDDEHLYPDFYNQPDVRKIFAAFQETPFRRRVLKSAREDPAKSNRFLAVWADYMAQPPLSGIILRQSVLINLVSTLEIFVDGVLKGYSLHVPTEPKINDRLDWGKRWEFLDNINPSPLWQSYRDSLREIIARRNALMHQGGRIAEDGYFKQTKEINSLRPPGAAEGRFLLVPTTYLQEAFDTTILFAFALSQSAWRTWCQPRHSQTADRLASNFIYQTLRHQQYLLVHQLADIAITLKPGWKNRSYILVNQAIACEHQGSVEAFENALSQLEKRKKHTWATEMAIHLLRKRLKKAHMLLKVAAQKGKLKEISPYWPLFEPIRDEIWFKALFAARRGELPQPH